MLDIIALSIILFSVIILVWSLISNKKESSSPKKKPSAGIFSGGQEASLPPIKDFESSMGEGMEEMDDGPMSISSAGPEMESRPSAARSGILDEKRFKSEPVIRDKRKQFAVGSTLLERKASLVYWERMCLEEEFDLTVTLHRPDFKVAVPDGASVHESETVYQLPKTGHVRVIPVCSGCNISPAYRDMKVAELDVETRAEFKVLPLQQGKFDLNVEFQVVNHDGQIVPLGVESATVSIQKKPIELNLGALNISVSRRVPTFFSIVGSFFGLISFVLARIGINVNEEIYAWSTTISAGVAGAVMILLAMMLLIKGVRPLMREISISLN